jgi:hypothetical protein
LNFELGYHSILLLILNWEKCATHLGLYPPSLILLLQLLHLAHPAHLARVLAIHFAHLALGPVLAPVEFEFSSSRVTNKMTDCTPIAMPERPRHSEQSVVVPG